MFNDTITFFVRHDDGNTCEWFPHVVSGCWFNDNRAANIEKTGLENADSARVHVPFGYDDGEIVVGDIGYLAPKAWAAAGCPSNVLTFQEGEGFFLLGEYPETTVDDDDYERGLFQHLNTTMDGVYRITTVGRYKVIPHFEIGGA